jgi:iron complex outermembrane receptor protein
MNYKIPYNYLFILFCLLGLINTIIAQNNSANCNYIFKGKLINGETKEAFQGVIINIQELGKGVVTDNNGEFVIENLCHQSYNFKFSYIGYKTLTNKYHIHSNKTDIIQLHSDTCHLESVTVTAKSNYISNVQSVLELSEKELDLTRGQSLGEALKALNGVNAIQTGPSIFKPVIEGLYGNRVLIMNNEIRLEGQNWGADHAPEIDPFVATKISVIKGAGTVKYGADALGGVVLVDPSELRTEKGVNGQLNLVGNSNNRQGIISGIIDYVPAKIKGLSTRIQGTYDKGGNYKTPNYYLKNTGSTSYNGSLSLRYIHKSLSLSFYYSILNNKIGIFEGAHLHTVGDVENVIANGKPFVTSGFSYEINKPYQQVLHELTKLKTTYNINNTWDLELITSRQYNYRAEFDIDQPLRNIILKKDIPTIDFSLTSYSNNLNISHKRINNFKGEIGLNHMIQFNNVSSSNVRLFIPDYQMNNWGVYLLERWKKQQFEIEGGLRVEQKNYEVERNKKPDINLKYLNFSWCLGMNYFINENWKTSVNIGQAKRAPAINELFSDGLHHGDGVFVFGDTTLNPESSLNLHWVTNYFFKNTFGEINIYQNNINNYIYYKPSGQLLTTVRGTYPVFNYTQTNAVFRGIDASFNQKIHSHITLGSKFSYLWAYDQVKTDYLIFIPANKIEINSKYQFKDFSKILKSFIGIQFQYVFEQKNTPHKNVIDASTKGVIFNNLANTGDYLAPPAAYKLFGLTAGLEIPISNQKLDINLVVNNLFNTIYRDYLNRFRYYSDEIGRNISIKIKYTF